LILRKIIKIVATRCHILRLKCTKFDFGWGSAQTPLGSSQRSPDLLTAFEGVILLRKGKGIERKGRGKKRKKGERGGRGRKGGEVASWLWGWTPLTIELTNEHYLSQYLPVEAIIRESLEQLSLTALHPFISYVFHFVQINDADNDDDDDDDITIRELRISVTKRMNATS